MSAARKTLKILALIYFVLGIASLVIGIAGIATGKLESTYGSNAMLAAVVLVAKGVAAVATLAQAVLTLPAFGGDAINFGAFVIVVYDLFFVQQVHAVKAENKDRL